MLTHATRFLRNGAHFAMFELLYMRRDLVKMKSYIFFVFLKLEIKHYSHFFSKKNSYMEDALKLLETCAEKTKATEKGLKDQ